MIVCAFALGFGVIRFMIVARNERGARPPKADTPPADRDGTRSEGEPASQVTMPDRACPNRVTDSNLCRTGQACVRNETG